MDFLEAALSLPKAFFTAEGGLTTEASCGRILGERNWERALHPALDAVASQGSATIKFPFRPERAAAP